MTGFLLLLAGFAAIAIGVYYWTKDVETGDYSEFGYKVGPEDDDEA